MDFDRRRVLTLGAMLGLGPLGEAIARDDGAPRIGQVERWMAQWMDVRRGVEGPLHVGRFRDPTYYLLKPIAWKPNSDSPPGLGPVTVPAGFVTDFASVPRAFWSMLRPDGEYAYAAVVHDYMYWQQTADRATSDEVLRAAMQDLGVGRRTVSLIYEAVRIRGQGAWDENARLKRRGECRILRSFPEDPRIDWSSWKTRPDVCA